MDVSGENFRKFQGILQVYGPSLVLGAIPLAIYAFVRKFNLLYQWRHPVDKASLRHGGELVAKVLQSHGIQHVFTLCGGHISPILVACEKLGMRVIDTRHEVTAVFAADATARLSGTVGVAAVTAGPGLTNTVTAVKNAQMAESPLLLMGGAAGTLLKGRGALQDIDQMSLFKPLCKYTASIRAVRDIVPTVRRALCEAQSGTPGPVFIEFPIDVLYPYPTVAKEFLGTQSAAKSLMARIVNWYLSNHLGNLFAGAWDECDVTPLKTSLPLATSSQISQCARLVKGAKRPVIVLGSQASLPPIPVDKLRQSLESLGIPCFLGGMTRGLLGRNSPLHIRQRRRDALKEADVIILAGAVCDFRLSYGRGLSRKAKIIAVNRSKEQLYKNSDLFWKPTLAVEADPASFLVSVQEQLTGQPGHSGQPGQGYAGAADWARQLKRRDDEKEADNHKKSGEPVDAHLNPLKVLHTLEESLDDNSIIVADGGDFVGSAAYILRPRGPLRWLDPGAFGTLGVGGGFALGAKLCRPDSDVWIIYGDGSLGYSLMEFDTYKRHNLPVIAVVGNDACWTQISREQVPMFGSNVGCQLAFSDYHLAVAPFGAHGVRLDRESESRTREIFLEAARTARDGQSVLINVLIGKTNFRDGSISV